MAFATRPGRIPLNRPLTLREIVRAAPLIGVALEASRVEIVSHQSTGLVLARVGSKDQGPLSVPRLGIWARYENPSQRIELAYSALLDPEDNLYPTLSMNAPTGVEDETAARVSEWMVETEKVAEVLNGRIPEAYDEWIERLL